MSIQQEIDEQSQDEGIPRGVITISNDTGSVSELKEGYRLNLLECSDVDVSGNEGNNELSFTKGTGITVSDFINGVLRFDGCSDLREVTATSTKVNADGTDIQTADLTNCETNLIGCQPQSATFSACDLNSFKCEYQDLSLSGGQAYLDNDQVETLKIDQGAHVTAVQLESSGDSTVEESNLTLQEPTFDGQLTITDSHLMSIQGEFEELTIEGKSTVVMQTPTIKGQVEITDAQIHLTDATCEGELTLDGVNATLTGPSCESDVTITDCQLVVIDGTFKSDTTIERTAARLVGTSFEGDLEITDGALESSKCIFEGDINQTGGNITSFRDTMKNATFDSLIGPSIIRDLSGAQEINLTGDGNATLLLDKLSGVQKIEINEFASVRLTDIEATEIIIDNVTILQMDYVTCPKVEANTCSQAIINETNQIAKLTLDTVQLAVTNSITAITANDSTIIDNGSTFLTADDCQIIGTSTQIAAADNCILQMQDGTVVANDSVILAKEGTITAAGSTMITTSRSNVINAEGLTVGTDFSFEASASAICYDGNLNVYVGIGSLIETVVDGEIVQTAALGITRTAGLDIIDTAGGIIDSLAQTVKITATDITVNGEATVALIGANISETAEESILQTAPNIVQV